MKSIETWLDYFMSDIDNRCTFFPNGDWLPCCIWHDWQSADARYRMSWDGRLSADIELRRCVLEDHGRPIIAWMMYIGVRLWAHIIWRFVYGITPSKVRRKHDLCLQRS